MFQKIALCGILLLASGLTGCGSRDSSPSASAPAPPPGGSSAPSAPQPAAQTAAKPSDAQAAGDSPSIGQSQGDPFDVKQFLASRSVPKDNAIASYVSALEKLDKLGDLGDFKYGDKLQSGEIPQQRIEQTLRSAAPLLEQIDRAQMKPSCPFVTDLGRDTELPQADGARQVAALSRLQLHVAGAKGDAALVGPAIKRGLRLSRDLRPLGGFVCQIISNRVADIVLDGIVRFTLSSPKLTIAQCDQVLSMLVEHQQQRLDCCQEGVRVEYIYAHRAIEDYRPGGEKAGTLAKDIQEMIKEKFGKPDTPEKADKLDKSAWALSKVLDCDAERAACTRLFAAAVRDAQAPYRQLAAVSEYEAEMAKQSQGLVEMMKQAGQTKTTPAKPVFLILLLAQESRVVKIMRLVATTSEANLAGVESLTAIRRFELSHGRLPETLDQAVSETVLKTVPTDPFSGQPMRYVVINGKPTVYSTGDDLKDDGGRTDWEWGKKPGDYLFTMAPLSKTPPGPKTDASASPVKTRPAPKIEAKPAPVVRIWTSTVRTTVEAEFIGREDDVVLLKKRDGTVLRVPLDKLSEQDRQWIQQTQK